MSTQLDIIKSVYPLHILHLSAGKTNIYLSKSKKTTHILPSSGLKQPTDLALFASQWPNVPWAILVDQSEETFWGDVMPVMRGAAKTAWIERLSSQSGTDSPFHWFELQGKSRTQPDKIRVLGYTLGHPETLTPWLEALQGCNARIRGVYTPVMLVSGALNLLKVKPPKSDDTISVLVTPHADGLRQSVLVGGSIRFSRLALHPLTDDTQWFETVYSETARLREYLIGNGLLKNDRTGMHLYVVQPASKDVLPPPDSTARHVKDQYQWLNSPLADLVYLASLAKKQPRRQLAPAIYRKHDLSIYITNLVYGVSAVFAAAALVYIALFLAQLWQMRSDVAAATSATDSATQQYQTITKSFPNTPLTAAQLVDMNKRWEAIKTKVTPDMRSMLVIVGETLDKHPKMVIEFMEWSGEAPSKPVSPVMPGVPVPVTKEKADIASLVLRGNIRGIASDDLRGTRDALAKLVADFNRIPDIRAEITKKPLDLSAKASLSGSGKQDASELHFEIKIWQR